ncbi:MAG: hypothetical protein ACYC2Y_04640 [Armatimonadota bacterium]
MRRLMLIMLLGLSTAAAHATSASLESGEPILPPPLNFAHGRASFMMLLNSDLYDAAGDLGATFRLGSAGEGSFYFLGDMFTWIDIKSNLDFNPQRIEYTLEPGYAIQHGRGIYSFFVKHQSFHDVDFTDDIDESYELYGARYSRTGSHDMMLRVGKYLNTRDVDYDWDLAGQAIFYTKQSDDERTYLKVWAHHVTVEGNRSDFTDYAGEVGIEYRSGATVFVQYAFLHDLDRANGQSEHLLLVGPRYEW